MIWWILAATLDLWVWFAISIWVANGAKRWEDLPLWKKPVIGYFLFKDWFYKRTVWRVLFWEMGRKKDKTVTAGVKYILHSGAYLKNEWRYKLALRICEFLIEPIHFGHCSLGRLD